MRKLTIVDDDIVFTKKIKKAIGRYYLEKGRSIELLVYHKAELVLYDVKEKKYSDIYLLDIEMSDINGIELATRVKDAYKKAYIIFITSHLQFTLDAFDVKAYQYIPKDQNILIERLFFASTFWTKLQNIFGHCCMSKLDKVAKPWLAMIRPAI